MSEPYVGEIRMFAGNFAPRGWAFTDGQLLAVSQNDALFSLLGTIYGGDGRTTFGLPDLRGRVPIHQGEGPGLSMRRLGAKFGAESVTLLVDQLPSHTHQVTANRAGATQAGPQGNVLGATSNAFYYNSADGDLRNFNPQAVENTGSTQPHSNLMPTLCVHFIIALVGVYPSRH